MKKILFTIAAAFSLQCVFAQLPTNGLAAFYSFNDSTVNDQHLNNHGINNGATFADDRFGNANSAVYFNGSSYIDCGDSVEFDLTYQTGISISCWAKPTSFGSLRALVTKWNQSPSVEQYGLWLNGNDHFAAFGQIASSGYNINTNVFANEWHHVVLTYDTTSGVATLYLDGIEFSSNTVGTFPGSSGTNNLSIGAQLANTNGSAGSLSRYFYGYIDDVRIYSRQIDSSEVVSLYYEPNYMANIAEVSTSSDSPVCTDDPGTVTVASSQDGVDYYLTQGGSIVDGPVAGTGSNVSLTTGTLSAASSFTVTGSRSDAGIDYDNSAISFDGADDYISVPLNSTFLYDTGYTIETWVKVPHPDNTNRWATIFSIFNADSTDIELYVQNSTNDLIVAHNRGKISTGGRGYTDPPNDEWFHLAVVFDGVDATVYYNGEPQSIVQQINPLQPVTRSNNAEIALGVINSSSFTWNSYYNGLLDNVRVWNTERTQTEIQDNMYKCLSGSENGLVHLFKFDGGNTSSVVNYAAGTDAQMVNMDSVEARIPSAAIQCGMDITAITIEVEDCPLALGEAQLEDVKVHPNPTTGLIFLKGFDQIQNVTVLDAMGKMVFSGNTTTLNLSEFDQGLYLLKVTDQNGTKLLRVVKQ